MQMKMRIKNFDLIDLIDFRTKRFYTPVPTDSPSAALSANSKAVSKRQNITHI